MFSLGRFLDVRKEDRSLLGFTYYAFLVSGMMSTVLGAILPSLSSQYQLSYSVQGSLLSFHQIGNLLAVYGAAVLLGLDRQEVLRVLSTLHPVSGRFEVVRAANGTTAVVDYAHTPDALENVLRTIEEIRTPDQQLIVVCGCGGDRDRTKRPEMAQIAVRYATIKPLVPSSMPPK